MTLSEWLLKEHATVTFVEVDGTHDVVVEGLDWDTGRVRGYRATWGYATPTMEQVLTWLNECKDTWDKDNPH